MTDRELILADKILKRIISMHLLLHFGTMKNIMILHI